MSSTLDRDLLEAAQAAIRNLFGSDVGIDGHERIPGQASNRRYFRLRLSGDRAPGSLILVRLPEDTFGSDEATDVSCLAELPFCTMLRFLRRQGLPVPHLHLDQADEGYMLQEDLGPVTMFAALGNADDQTVKELYRQAIDLLVRFQTATGLAPLQTPPSDCIGYSRTFTPELLRWELDHFKEWGLLDHRGADPTAAEMSVIDTAFDEIVAALSGSNYWLAHRDFQSTNLMMPDPGRMVMIDFQDALMAPPVYDLVSLLRDSYVYLAPATLHELLDYYHAIATTVLPISGKADFHRLFHLQTVQRKLKDAGRFVFIDRVKGNPAFLRWVDPTLGYVRLALANLPEYASLHKVLAEHVPALK